MTTMTVEVQFLSPASDRAELVDALLRVCAAARREMKVDHLGRPNARWAHLHEFMNSILDLLDDKPLYVEE